MGGMEERAAVRWADFQGGNAGFVVAPQLIQAI